MMELNDFQARMLAEGRCIDCGSHKILTFRNGKRARRCWECAKFYRQPDAAACVNTGVGRLSVRNEFRARLGYGRAESCAEDVDGE